LVFYAQSTSAVISGRNQSENTTKYNKNERNKQKRTVVSEEEHAARLQQDHLCS